MKENMNTETYRAIYTLNIRPLVKFHGTANASHQKDKLGNEWTEFLTDNGTLFLVNTDHLEKENK